MLSLRSPEMKERYREYVHAHLSEGFCPICSTPALQTFTYWKIMVNSFPYDLIAATHHMIVPLRHVVEAELSADELREFALIKREVIDIGYDNIIEATTKNKSLPAHFHLHLIVGKD